MTSNLALGNAATEYRLTTSDSNIPSGTFELKRANNSASWGSSYQNQTTLTYVIDDINGNLYNWWTATAGSGTSALISSAGNATSSICPNGWVLPNGQNEKNTIRQVLDIYSIGYKWNTCTAWNVDIRDDINGGPSNEALRLLLEFPFNYTLSGRHKLSNESPSYDGLNITGTYWTNTPSTHANYAEAFALNNASTSGQISIWYPYSSGSGNSGDGKARGNSIRCVSV